MPFSRPTLLLFTLGADLDSQRHPLLRRGLHGEERALREACLAQALDAGEQAGCRIVISSPQPVAAGRDMAWIPQDGDTFGNRLRAAMARAFAEARGPVLVVGADAPGLTAAHLRRALAALEHDPEAVVLGPAADGGVYLLGALRPFDTALAAARWCDRGTRVSLRRALAAEERPVLLLDPLLDLDRPADLERWITDGGSGAKVLQSLARRLSVLLAAARRPLSGHAAAPGRDSSWARLLAGRAPPPPLAR